MKVQGGVFRAPEKQFDDVGMVTSFAGYWHIDMHPEHGSIDDDGSPICEDVRDFDFCQKGICRMGRQDGGGPPVEKIVWHFQRSLRHPRTVGDGKV